MYRVLGADSKEYGPVTAEVLRQWIAEGRANAQTRVRPEGGTEWMVLGHMPEFESAFPTGPGLVQPVMQPSGPARTSRLAISSLVLGILGVLTCGITALVGLVLGIVALVKVNRSGGQLSGKGLAIAGICTSGLFFIMMPIFAALLLPALAQAKAQAQLINCLNNVKQLELGVIMYAKTNGDKYPPADQWCDAILANVGGRAQTFRCPADSTGSRSDYAFNEKLSELPMTRITKPARTVVIFESDGGWNQRGGRDKLPQHRRHPKGVIIGFADGHAELVGPSRLGQLVWDP